MQRDLVLHSPRQSFDRPGFIAESGEFVILPDWDFGLRNTEVLHARTRREDRLTIKARSLALVLPFTPIRDGCKPQANFK